MDSESLEYTKLPAAQAAKKTAHAAGAPASAAGPGFAAAVAAAVVSCVTAGALLLLNARHSVPPRPATAPAAQAPGPAAAPAPRVESGPAAETRGASPLPLPMADAARPEAAGGSAAPAAGGSAAPAAGGPAAPAAALAAALAAAQAAHSPPAWAAAAVVQRWVWPRSLNSHVSDGVDRRRIVSWDPRQAAGQRAQFEVLSMAPGAIRFAAGANADLERVRAIELRALAQKKGAVAYQDVRATVNDRPVAELTYADGRKEVVPYDPLVFDLKGTGVKSDSRRVLFDLYGSGQADKLQWMSDLDGGTGILVFDADGGGRSGKTGAEVFGDRTDLSGVGRPSGFENGFEALRALVKKAAAEGVIPQGTLDRGVLEAADLAALEKAYGLRMKVGGFNQKAVSLAQAGVAAIALSDEKTERLDDFDGRSNSLVAQPGAVFLRTDGTTGTYMNVWLKANEGAPKLSARKFSLR